MKESYSDCNISDLLGLTLILQQEKKKKKKDNRVFSSHRLP